jgi:predicted nucleic acid-binding Zn ribbon protein
MTVSPRKEVSGSHYLKAEGDTPMYCSACGTPVTAGLSYCNRCGMNLKERGERKQTGAIAAFLIAITLIGTIGMGIMLGGALSLTTEAHLKEELVGFFMLFTFLIIAITEILLVRQLSRLTGANQAKTIEAPQTPAMPSEFRPPQPRTLAEPLPSVTENTTRTLEYSRNEPSR